MNTWNEGYFTDSTYTYGYYRELSPNFMRWCLLIKGIVAPDDSGGGCHCELGYGQGISANIHAAATPGKFFGTDFNPAHAAMANELLQASGADAKFFEDSFEEFAKRDDLSQFDSIGVHGIWSWISDENRGHIMEIARRHLKSGGMFYNSYNCLPGWAPAAPLRELLTIYDQYLGHRGSTNARVDNAMKFVDDMLAAQPAYTKIAPNFAGTFNNLKKHSRDYLAHEYLNLDWDLMYFTDVAEISQAAKLDFATSATPSEAIEDNYLPKAAQNFLNKIDNPLVREQARDYFINRQFRKDIFVRGLRRMNPAAVAEKILSTRYALHVPAATVKPKFMTTVGELNVSNEMLRSLLEYLQEDNFRAKNLTDYIKRNPSVNPGILTSFIVLLVNDYKVMPCQSEEVAAQVQKTCRRLNAHICERSKVAEAINFLASPLTGCAVMANRLQQIFLSQVMQGHDTADELAAGAWKIFAARGESLITKEKHLDTPQENLNRLNELAREFLTTHLPIFKALLIV